MCTVYCAHLHGDGLHPLDELLRDLVRGHHAVLHQHEPARAAADGDTGVPPHLHTFSFTIRVENEYQRVSSSSSVMTGHGSCALP